MGWVMFICYFGGALVVVRADSSGEARSKAGDMVGIDAELFLAVEVPDEDSNLSGLLVPHE